MNYKIPILDFPSAVDVSDQLLDEERSKPRISKNRNTQVEERNDGFHEKKAKNMKTNQGGSYKAKLAKKYKKPQRKGDKIANRRSKKRRK